jgi:hypothetical protein
MKKNPEANQYFVCMRDINPAEQDDSAIMRDYGGGGRNSTVCIFAG